MNCDKSELVLGSMRDGGERIAHVVIVLSLSSPASANGFFLGGFTEGMRQAQELRLQERALELEEQRLELLERQIEHQRQTESENAKIRHKRERSLACLTMLAEEQASLRRK